MDRLPPQDHDIKTDCSIGGWLASCFGTFSNEMFVLKKKKYKNRRNQELKKKVKFFNICWPNMEINEK